MSKQRIKSKLDEFEKRLQIDGQTFTRDEVFRYHRVLTHIKNAVLEEAEKEILKEFSHNDYVKFTEISIRIINRMMKPPYDTPVKYARQHWPHFWDMGGTYDLWMRGEEPGAHPTL